MLRETRDAETIGDRLPPGFSPEVVLCLVATTPNEARPSGTAVMISPHCALTAKHVVDDYIEMTAAPESELSILGRSGFVPKHQNRDWRFNQVVRVEKSDIALLVLASNQPPVFGLNYPKINLIPPEPGEVIVAMGFHSSNTVASADGAGPLRAWEDTPTISRGVVFEVHHQARDKILMPHPCFMADCDVRGGMSGGPVFDETGFIRGIISRSIAPIDKTILCSTLDYGPSLYDSVLRGRILASGIQRIAPTYRGDGSLKTLSLMEH